MMRITATTKNAVLRMSECLPSGLESSTCIRTEFRLAQRLMGRSDAGHNRHCERKRCGGNASRSLALPPQGREVTYVLPGNALTCGTALALEQKRQVSIKTALLASCRTCHVMRWELALMVKRQCAPGVNAGVREGRSAVNSRQINESSPDARNLDIL